MRRTWLIALTVIIGCASSDQQMRSAPDGNAGAGLAPDGSSDDAGTARADDVPPEIKAVVVKAVAAYDRVLTENCQCLVAAGGFATMADCLAPSASGPTWVPCGSRVLAAMDSPETRALAHCLADELTTRAECLSDKGCDNEAQSTCAPGALQCTRDNPAVLVQLINACPDLGLLSRL